MKLNIDTTALVVELDGNPATNEFVYKWLARIIGGAVDSDPVKWTSISQKIWNEVTEITIEKADFLKICEFIKISNTPNLIKASILTNFELWTSEESPKKEKKAS